MREIWKDITGYVGRYQVSSAGKVKSIKRATLTTNDQNRTYQGKILANTVGIKLKVLAKQFSMSESAISEVARGTTWGWEKGT